MASRKTAPLLIAGFNQKLSRLASSLVMMEPNNVQLARGRLRLSALMDTLPNKPIELAGPTLLKYADQIIAGDAEYFMKYEFKDELAESDDAETVMYFINVMRNIWTDLPSDDRAGLIQLIQDMFGLYLEFLRLDCV